MAFKDEKDVFQIDRFADLFYSGSEIELFPQDNFGLWMRE